MSAQAITLRLPPPLYELLRQRAQETRRSLEAEVLDVVMSAVRPDVAQPPDLREVASQREDQSPSVVGTSWGALRMDPAQVREILSEEDDLLGT